MLFSDFRLLKSKRAMKKKMKTANRRFSGLKYAKRIRALQMMAEEEGLEYDSDTLVIKRGRGRRRKNRIKNVEEVVGGGMEVAEGLRVNKELSGIRKNHGIAQQNKRDKNKPVSSALELGHELSLI